MKMFGRGGCGDFRGRMNEGAFRLRRRAIKMLKVSGIFGRFEGNGDVCSWWQSIKSTVCFNVRFAEGKW
jgi:hypothetical protein